MVADGVGVPGIENAFGLLRQVLGAAVEDRRDTMTPTLTAQRRRQYACAAHEASHAVAGVLAGAEVDRAEVLHQGPRSMPDVGGYVAWMPFDFRAAARQRDIFAAGPVGEALYLYGDHPTAAQIATLLRRNHRDYATLERISMATRQPLLPDGELITLLRRCWPSIAELGARLHRDHKIGHHHVLAALGLPADPVAQQHAVAMIRSGCEPHSFTVTPALAG